MQTNTIDASSEDFGVLARQIREAGLLKRRLGYYGAKIPLTVAAFGAGFAGLVLVGNSWFALLIAVFLGLVFTQLGFVGHDAGHQEVFRSRRANRLLGFAVGNVLIGMSFGWWVPKHSAHHAHPNEIGRDPDIGDGPVNVHPDGQDAGGNRLTRAMERWRVPLFFPLMILRSTGIYVLGIRRLIRERNGVAGVEGALLALHVGLYLTCVFWVLSPLKAVAFIAVQQAVFSVYLGCSFAPNHKGMPIIEPDSGLSFVRRQVITSRNIAGGRFTNLLLGGLNYQIEHHLFPNMPRPNLARAQGIVRAFCLENNLGYREDSLIGSYRQTLNSLRGSVVPSVARVPVGVSA
ncbi:MAG: acyl-CoA desaturase [Acidimicrobiales bacterium]